MRIRNKIAANVSGTLVNVTDRNPRTATPISARLLASHHAFSSPIFRHSLNGFYYRDPHPLHL